MNLSRPDGTSDLLKWKENRNAMIKFIKGNLLEADVEALVNTINTVGVMGKGIALQFRETFLEN